MSKNPVLVLQFRRLGDIILTFPLLEDIRRLYPGRPIFVGAQPIFYRPLQGLCPNILFFPPESLAQFAKVRFECAINLGGDELSSLFMGQIDAERKLGKIKQAGAASITGFWQLYRESLTLNNRHNIFHWADLFRMDLAERLEPQDIAPPRAAGQRRIGLFIGASEAAKRPLPEFWITLSKKIAAYGLKPVILGGQAEIPIASAIFARNVPAINLCGRTNLAQLASILKTLDFLITPDTGPMHLAALLSTPVLNLSMGNVNAAETGPYGPGQRILRADLSCAGCWQCKFPKPLCKNRFAPASIGKLLQALLEGNDPGSPPGLELLTTAHDGSGYHVLTGGRSNARTCLDDFWKSAFLTLGGKNSPLGLNEAAQRLKRSYPGIARDMRNNLEKMILRLFKRRPAHQPLSNDFWEQTPTALKIFAGFIHMSLQNDNYAPAMFTKSIKMCEQILAAVETP